METISRKKPNYPVSKEFRKFLKRYGREVSLPISYSFLRHFASSTPVYDAQGKDTLWESVWYHPSLQEEINENLKQVYSLLKSGGQTESVEHLHIERIDFCLFGNSHPFRIKIVNNYNEVYDYFYIKQADASRILGLELEHIVSPYWINFLVDQTTLVEEHIIGVPGDQFIKHYLGRPEFNPKRIAKEFVKFNERCFFRLLGDMRSYNFVFDITQDFDDIQFRIRAIDFDQQCYEGRKNLYLPQFFKENKIFVDLALEHCHPDVIHQYQLEERSQIVRRVRSQRHRLKDLHIAVVNDSLSTPEKTAQLSAELSEYHQDPNMANSKTMGELIKAHIKAQIRSTLQKQIKW
jgi:hypothetical protein